MSKDTENNSKEKQSEGNDERIEGGRGTGEKKPHEDDEEESKETQEDETDKESKDTDERIEGGRGTGVKKPLDGQEDEMLADEAQKQPVTPTKPPTGPKPGEIEA